MRTLPSRALLLTAVDLLLVIQPYLFAQSLIYSVQQITSQPIDHEWPSINSQGTVVWSKAVSGPCQSYGQSQPCWTPYEQAAGQPESKATAVITNPVHDYQYPVIDNQGDIVYLKDTTGAGPGLVVDMLTNGVETQLEYSSGSPPGCLEPPQVPIGQGNCNSWRGGGPHFGVSELGTVISYFDFCSPLCARTFNVSGTGQSFSLPQADADYPDTNASDFVYSSGGQIYKASLSNPASGVPIASAAFPRINKTGNVVGLAPQVTEYFAPNYTTNALVSPGTWSAITADAYGQDLIAYQNFDKNKHAQVFLASLPNTIDISSGTYSASDWQNMKASGIQFVIVKGAGGTKKNGPAAALLSGAQNAGLPTALYCFLVFTGQSTGTQQMNACTTAAKTALGNVGFIAVDVEGVSSISPQAAVQIISDAIAAIPPGHTPVVYSDAVDWQNITGETTSFASYPLWDNTSYQEFITPDGKTHCGDGVASLAVDKFSGYGGWTVRSGKQFDIGITTSKTTCNATGTKRLGKKVDLNYFTGTMF